MGCVKLSILDEQYKKPELRVSSYKKELTPVFFVGDERRVSLYSMCGNNPIKNIDPDGCDWYENEITGQVYFNSQKGKNDAGTGNMQGEGWKWMGGNDMLGEVNDNFFANNQEFSNGNTRMGSWYIISPDEGLSTGYEMDMGDNSKAFMDKMGYKSVPTQVIEYRKYDVQRELTPAGTISFDLGCRTQITEKVGYVPKDFRFTGQTQIGEGVYSKGSNESAIKLNLSYGKGYSGRLAGVAKIWSAIFGGNHDYSGYGPCLPNTELINQLRNRK
jgi:hypothetical protein